MKIVVKRADRKSIAYSLAPEELTILVPNYESADFKLEKALCSINGNLSIRESMTTEEFQQIMNNWIEKLQVKPGKTQLKRMKSKWASCSRGKSVNFNSLLINMPKEFVDYVICHELLHLKVPNHSKLFKNLLAAYMPDWQERISKTIDYVLAQNNGKMA
jgi:hypothetical protein